MGSSASGSYLPAARHRPVVTDLDPTLATVVDDLETRLPSWGSMSVAEARTLEDELFSAGDGPAVAAVEERTVAGPAGAIPVREYTPETVATPATLVYAHGGGFVLGTLDSTDDVCRRLADRVGCVVRSVDYRLAPEHRFPAAVEDVWAVVAATAGEGDEPELATEGPVAVGGASAGGCLAAAAALRARDEGLALTAQLLLYPMLDPRLDRPSHEAHADGPLLTRADLAWFWDLYLPESREDDVDPLASPLAGDPAGTAPAVVATAGSDPLRDEGRAYARALADAGVTVADLQYPSLCHGFASLTDRVPAADEAVDEVVARVRERLP